jgi:predicted ABC-type sugar transport system permease subunit
MNRAFTDWNSNVAELGPLYPFVGLEFLMVIVLLVVLVVWYIAQIGMENRQLNTEAAAMRKDGVLQRAIAEEKVLERM